MEALAPYFASIQVSSNIRELIVFLLAAVLIVPLFRRLKASPVLGYLLIGAIIGPFGLQVISDVEGAKLLGEYGVVFLLFTIGLDLSLERLASMSRLIFGLGGAQVITTGLIIGAIAWAWGNEPPAAIILGVCLALSSTAIITQLLVENGEFGSRFGRTVFAVLLLQDLAVVPLLVMVNALSSGAESLSADLILSLGKSFAAVGIIIVFGRMTLRPLFRMVAGANSPELLMAMTLLAILATAIGTGLAGLSMALGAFLAGMLLAETEFRHQVEIDIQPFKGLLLGLFFISVGMGIDLDAVLGRAFMVILSVFGLIGLKVFIFLVLGQLFHLPRPVTLRGALLLGTGGEFALLVIGAAMTSGALDPATGQFMMIVAALSMAVTPLMLPLGQWLILRLRARTEQLHSPLFSDVANDLSGHVIIAGFGRVGQTIAALLTVQKVPYVALDLNPHATSMQRQNGMPVYYGDVERPEVLERLGIGKAAALVLTIDTPLTAKKALAAIRSRWPHIPVYVRARDSSHSRQLEILGATGVVPETLEASLALAGQVLSGIGTPIDAVNILINRIREEHYAGIASIGTPQRNTSIEKKEAG
ncbi:MAG: monovalent cation:proton antiporter-2 (CPA2) family protein [Alphaproteobacteria bacterium]